MGREARLWLARAPWLVLGVLACGCALPSTPSQFTVPPRWRSRRPFGPEANAARVRGDLQPLYMPAQAGRWDSFARTHVQDGDVLFRLGRSCTVRGQVMSLLLAGVSDSRFSHAGLACWEGDRLWVYDAEGQGVRKIPFVFWMMDARDGHFAVKRLLPDYRHGIPAALAYCEDAYRREVPYDLWLRGDEDHMYCTELIARAFRAAGVELAEPLPIRRYPHYRRFYLVGLAAETLTPLSLDEPVHAIGNVHYGIYGSPYLELVYEEGSAGEEGRKPPRSEAGGE